MLTSYSNKYLIFYEPWVTSKQITLQMRPKWLDYPILIHSTFNPSCIKGFDYTLYSQLAMDYKLKWNGKEGP